MPKERLFCFELLGSTLSTYEIFTPASSCFLCTVLEATSFSFLSRMQSGKRKRHGDASYSMRPPRAMLTQHGGDADESAHFRQSDDDDPIPNEGVTISHNSKEEVGYSTYICEPITMLILWWSSGYAAIIPQAMAGVFVEKMGRTLSQKSSSNNSRSNFAFLALMLKLDVITKHEKHTHSAGTCLVY